MFGRMTAADDDGPLVSAELERVAVGDATIGGGKRINHVAERTELLAVALDGRIVPPRRSVEFDRIAGRLGPRIGSHDAAGQIFQAAHPKLRSARVDEPTGQPAMIGMHMSHDHPAHRLAVQRAGECGLPGGYRIRRVQTGIDDRPSALLLHGPDVDPRKRREQRHSQPQDPGRHLHGRPIPDLRLGLQRIAQPRCRRRAARSHCRCHMPILQIGRRPRREPQLINAAPPSIGRAAPSNAQRHARVGGQGANESHRRPGSPRRGPSAVRDRPTQGNPYGGAT